MGSDPADGDVDVDRAPTLRVFLDRPIYPGDVHRGHAWVQSGVRSAFLSPWFDPVGRVLTAELIGSPLEPHVRYRMVIEDLRDLDLEPMGRPYEITFETGLEATPRPAPPAVGYDEVRPILAGCSVERCHGGDRPALGLDLSSPEGIQETAIGVAARQTRVGTQAGELLHGAPTLAGLAIVDVVGGVGRPARSYLLYKVLGDPHAGGDTMLP